MDDQEIRAKALEIAVSIKASADAPVIGGLFKDTNLILKNFLPLAEAIDKYIRNPSQSAGN